MYYFGDLLENECRKERYKLKMKSVEMPETIINMVMDWEDKYREDFMLRLYSGDCWKFAFSTEITLVYLDVLKDKEEQIKHLETLVKMLDIENERLLSNMSEIDRLNDECKKIYDSRAFVLSLEKEENVELKRRIKELEERNKRLMQEVNDRTWGKNKPYQINK